MIFTSCSSNKSIDKQLSGDTLTTHSSLLKLIDHGDYLTATISNPWETEAAPLQQLVIIDKHKKNPANLPDGIIVRTPIENTLVLSSVHAGIIKELGAIDRIKGVCDANFFKIPEIANGIKNGRIIDAGNSMNPSAEQIMLLNPDAILVSPYQNSNSTGFEKTGATIILCADYMESTPLGRAEWIKLLGALYGKLETANRIFNDVTIAYNEIKAKADSANHKPKIISEMVTDGVWYVPGGQSYMARLFQDAGTTYPWSDNPSSGSLPLDFATVYDKAHDADIWLVKMLKDASLNDIKSIYPLNEKFKAYHNGGIFACNSATATIYEDVPFHPEKLLNELFKIAHPSKGDTLNYYKKIDK